MKKEIVFTKEIDKGLLNLTFEDEVDNIYKLHPEGIKLEDIIYHEEVEYDEIDNSLISAILDNNIDLNQPVIAHICKTHIFGDYRTVIICKDFYLSVGYYSAGEDIAHFIICKWPEGEDVFFDEDLNFTEMNPVISIERE